MLHLTFVNTILNKNGGKQLNYIVKEKKKKFGSVIGGQTIPWKQNNIFDERQAWSDIMEGKRYSGRPTLLRKKRKWEMGKNIKHDQLVSIPNLKHENNERNPILSPTWLRYLQICNGKKASPLNDVKSLSILIKDDYETYMYELYYNWSAE